MRSIFILVAAAAALAGCAGNTSTVKSSSPAREPAPASAAKSSSGPASYAVTLSGYKHDVALHICGANQAKVYPGRPQALLRSVVVMKYSVDARGQLIRSEVMRSNHDGETESIALHSLRAAAPLPRPAPHLLHNGQLEVIETWLFNDDGRFQLRTVAQPQIDS
jgi:periplasmic protein TonB